MKTAIIVLFAIVCILGATAYPVEEEGGQEHYRVKRVTCDLLSAEARGVKVNHAACAAHCLIRGRSGGYCNGKRVCICR